MLLNFLLDVSYYEFVLVVNIIMSGIHVIIGGEPELAPKIFAVL